MSIDAIHIAKRAERAVLPLLTVASLVGFGA